MRPIRLELQGFTTFRDRQVVEFDDADYFALVGATGSGKSTLIDAICFALYGSVPRYDHVGLVAPVVTQGALEAKVSFDFAVGDAVYTAARVVRRTARGASTKEARLERGAEVLAGTADELTAAVTKLLGLPFEHFTRCVVLPQGEFARFLRDEPSKRQDLLVKLLNLGVYADMSQRANQLAAVAKNEVGLLRRRLEEDLAFATPEARQEAFDRIGRLDALRARVAATAPQLDELAKTAFEATTAAEDADGLVRALVQVSVPAGTEQLAAAISTASSLVRGAETALEEAAGEAASAHAAREALPAREPLGSGRDAHHRRRELEALAAPEDSRVRNLEAEHERAEAALVAAESAVAAAGVAREQAIRAEAAYDLASTLVPGEVCPVCLQPVTDVPSHAPPAEIERATEELEAASRARETARSAAAAASRAWDRAESRLATLRDQIAAIDRRLAPEPDLEVIEATLQKIDEADAAVAKARAEEARRRQAASRARHDLEALRDAEQLARDEFEAARDRLARLGPPPAERKDLAADWSQLVAWARAKVPEARAAAEAARARAAGAAHKRDSLLRQLQQDCQECGVAVEPEGDAAGAVVAALERAKARLDRIDEGLAAADDLRARLGELESDEAVARALARQLSARGFESWIVKEALQCLVVGASTILRELSGETYSLGVNDSGDFQVIDHHNADETRSAKTLSGGETFLASLSLALALADQLTELAAQGAARIEAIFLDEGFGTLDADTLETVAASIEQLASSGRMVGIVTHVRELAERVPVQFSVTKGPRTSSVERVSP